MLLEQGSPLSSEAINAASYPATLPPDGFASFTQWQLCSSCTQGQIIIKIINIISIAWPHVHLPQSCHSAKLVTPSVTVIALTHSTHIQWLCTSLTSFRSYTESEFDCVGHLWHNAMQYKPSVCLWSCKKDTLVIKQ